MKVAVLGASGFMGYDFVRELLARGATEPIVYCSSPRNLANLARHDVEIRLLPPERLAEARLDPDVAVVVNFAHPFETLDGWSPARQLEALARFLRSSVERSADLRLIHVSSMSVYEPFAAASPYEEAGTLAPPRSDVYARAKWALERRLRAIPGRALLVRPTVVYGPFGRPWTDRILAAFAAGDVAFDDLRGRVQPIWVGDVTRFLIERLRDFHPGVWNLAGPHELRWEEFLGFFESLVGGGRLLRRASVPDESAGRGAWARDLRAIAQALAREPAFRRMAKPFALRLPARLRERWLERLGAGASAVASGEAAGGPFCGGYFARDRLVSTRGFRARFPAFALRELEDTRDELAGYFRFRFTDAVLRESSWSEKRSTAR
jgi:nucleoside-diphosphate-sugar epimerase